MTLTPIAGAATPIETIEQLATAIQNGLRPIVTFKDHANDLEAYPEANIRARFIGAEIRPSEDMIVLRADYSEFDAHNLRFETSNYYDAKGNPTQTLRDTGKYEPQEGLYFNPSDRVDLWMDLADDAATLLHARFVASGSINTYVGWLENQLVAAEA